MLTPFGRGVDPCWQALLQNRSAVVPLERFAIDAEAPAIASTIPDLQYHGENSLVMQMLDRLLSAPTAPVPSDARLILATIKGEIDFLEKCILSGSGDAGESRLDRLLARVRGLCGVCDSGLVISAACTSSLAAAGRGAAMIRCGASDAVLVVACDAVSEFIYSGFSSLMALDKQPARPFDRSRVGLSVGEAAAYLLIMNRERAEQEGREILGEIEGWGMADDANHMTGPSRQSEGLISAIDAALSSARCSADDIGCISAHGTGTMYNDAMELGAFHALFGKTARPLYSIKGAVGHTMGAAGLLEIIIALKGLRERLAPPTVNLVEPDDAALGWASSQAQPIARGKMTLLTNAGFSGINMALVLGDGDRS
jgi:3-oxoacyl-[acyl-carrier-protein] synthase II